MFLDSCSYLDDDSFVLDFGNVPDLPNKVVRGIPSREISLRETWDLLDLGTHLRFIRSKSTKDILKPAWLSYEDVVRSIDDFSTYFWLPYGFNDVDHATVSAMDRLSVMVMDIDSDVDLLFWQKTRDQLQKWTTGDSLYGIPLPTMMCFSGKGIHPYWKMHNVELNKRTKNAAKVIHYVLRCKFSMYYTKKPLHRLNFNQSYRIPESLTKAGDRCKMFLFDDGFKGTLDDFIRCVVTPEEHTLLIEYINGDHSNDDLVSIQTKYGLLSGIESKEKVKRKKEEVVDQPVTIEKPLAPDSTDLFNQSVISEFADIINSDSSTTKKSFAKKVVYALKCQYPIREGRRTLRMLGMAISLSRYKAGTSREAMVRLVSLANSHFCDPPLLTFEINNICKDPDQYKFCSERKLKEFLGIKFWPVFIKRESTMTRQQAGKHAAETTQHRCIQKLVESYIELGFKASITKICERAGISRQTFFRYRDNGMLRAVFNWFINHGELSDQSRMELQRHLYRFKECLGRLSEEEADSINNFILANKSNDLSTKTS